MRDGIIIKIIGEEELYYIDEELTRKIISDIHIKYGHIGVKKIWLIYRENYYTKNDLSIIKGLCKTCKICMLGKYKNFHNKNTVESIIVKEPLEIIAIDYLSNLIKTRSGYKHILVIYDLFSKYVKFYPTKKTNKWETIRCLNEYIQEMGNPQKILTDNGTYFTNQTFKEYWEKQNIKIIHTTIRRPNANPSERLIEECLKYLRIEAQEEHREWDTKLIDIEKYINETPNTVTKIPPIIVMKNKLPDRPWQREMKSSQEIHRIIRTRVQKKAEKYKKKMNSKIKRKTKFKEGDLVIIRRHRVTNLRKNICKKLVYPYDGPYRISKVIGNNTYELKNVQSEIIKGRYHVEMIYPYHDGNKMY